MLLLNHHIFAQSNKNEVLEIYCSFSIIIIIIIIIIIFWEDMKLKKLAVALKFVTVLSLNSNVFC